MRFWWVCHLLIHMITILVLLAPTVGCHVFMLIHMITILVLLAPSVGGCLLCAHAYKYNTMVPSSGDVLNHMIIILVQADDAIWW